MLHNTIHTYGLVAKIFHWLVAIVVIGMFVLGWWMVELTYYDKWYKLAPDYHKSIGILLALVMVFRAVWRLYQPRPQAPSDNSLIEKRVAHWVHIILYLLIFTVMLFGYLISTADNRGITVFSWFEVPSLGELFDDQEDIAGWIHEWAAYGLIGLVFLHVLAALKHHWVDKDVTLKRML